jgi:hypothetical protein
MDRAEHPGGIKSLDAPGRPPYNLRRARRRWADNWAKIGRPSHRRIWIRRSESAAVTHLHFDPHCFPKLTRNPKVSHSKRKGMLSRP